jgi:hypothetical protein
MNNPIKIIHKFKNTNRNIQYKVYIFLGSLIDKAVLTILESISNKDFYTTLNTITKNEYKILEDIYGEYWYLKFFISYHIQSQINIINNISVKKKSIESKYGKEWYNKHIIEYKQEKISYSFATSYYNYLLTKGKIKSIIKKDDIDFRTYQESPLFKQIPVLEGGNENIIKDDDDDDDDDDEPKQITSDELQDQIEEEFNLEELTKLYSDVNIESNKEIMETSKLISEALNDKKWDKKIMELEYDSSLDNLAFDTKLEDIYNKYYITEQYLYKDDTIKTIRDKITSSIPISNNFGKNIRILPETQYLWCKYEIDNKMDKVMLGQKWIKRNELLKIDIEPNENINIYSKLRNNLIYLKEGFGHKIKREDDETNILRFYDSYITNNEIYMLDLYNDLGLNYNLSIEEKRNIYDVYIRIYYPYISYERYEQIIDLLNGENDKELEYINLHFNSLRNDLKLETEIENMVEKTKLKLKLFEKNFLRNHVIQSIIHVNILDDKNITGTISKSKFNLYRIFDNFIVNKKYPFIQYQTPDSQLTYKFYTLFEKENVKDNLLLLSRWFENAPYGISFKIRIENEKIKTNDKYISINLHDTGRIEYKITWKEEDNATMDDINMTYDYVRDLLKKINGENKKIKFILPSNDRFKYAFINTIQQFSLPNNKSIDHNDLSDFSRFFFPYVALVIEPKKRKSVKHNESDDISKFGTYLRYKRINKYENRNRMHLRMLYYLRNYDLNDRELIDEISKQFNITLDVAAKELDYVREKYQKVIVKSRKLFKKLKTLPKSKPPGIDINIQGRDKDKYKIRIAGARNKEQLDEILLFMKVLIFLYMETFINKNKEYQHIKNILISLNKIAKRRNKVIDIVDREATITNIKEITSLDKARLGFRPEKGQNQWSRSCQNSGKDKKRRPILILKEQIGKLIEDGYILNKTTGFYEKIINIKEDGKNVKTTIRAIKLPGEDGSYIYYTCDPSENNEHIYIGFLARGNNPNDLCMPCCFKKDHYNTDNKEKKDYFLQCLGDKIKTTETEEISEIGDKIYILQETNKIQDGRFIYLNNFLDIFFNKIWKNDYVIKNNYLIESKTGYFFKYTVKHDYYYFISALANIYNLTINQVINNFINTLKNDKQNNIFIYLNNGTIAESFKTKDNYINYINTSNYLEYDIVGELSAIPNVLSPNGIKFFIFNKKTITIKKALEKEITEDNFFLDCLNKENNYQFDENRDIVILIKEDKYYFPIYRIQKNTKLDKDIILDKFYYKNDKLNNIITELRNYYNISCYNSVINNMFSNNTLCTKNITNKLNNVVKQYIDDRNKCKYIELDNGLFLPVKLSGINYNIPFTYIKNIKTKWLPLTKTIKLLEKIEEKLNMGYKPKKVFYDIKSNNKINIVSLLLDNGLNISIFNELVTENSIKNMALSIDFQPLEETINKEIINWDGNIIFDDRLKKVKQHNYMNESYNLFRLEISLYLNNNNDIKENIINIVKNNKININNKKQELRKILFKIIDTKLLNEYKINMTGGKNEDKTMYIVNNIPNLKDYSIDNVRDYCKINKKDTCDKKLHCIWKNDSCHFQLTEYMAIEFVNKIIEEMIQDNIKFKEIIQEGTYYVSDIVDNSQYTIRDNQKLIRASSYNTQKLMSELFGKDNVPIIGKRQQIKIKNDIDEYPELIEIGNQLVQKIISNRDSIIRAYVNSFYWINNPLYDIKSRNLGYINDLQTILTYLFKANIIDFIQNNYINNINPDKNITTFLEKYFKKNNTHFFNSYINEFRKSSYNTDGIVELFVLSYLIDNPIVVYDNFSIVKYIFMQGMVSVNDNNIKTFTDNKNIYKTIYLKFDYDENSNIPKNIYSIYYR